MIPERIGRRAAVLLAFLTLLTTGASAQEGEQHAAVGSVSGRVIDARSGAALDGAVVALVPETQAVLPPAPDGSLLASGRAQLSDSAGRYRFDGLPPGRYRLRVSHLGYRAATVSVELRGAADSRVSVGLSVQAVALEPLEVRTPERDPFGRDLDLAAEEHGARRQAVRARQRATLSTDARELTHADVLESVTLGETDLFRALQRAPGVSARDDYSAGLWVRGASADQTRIYFDGLPLIHPLHAFGLLAAVNPDGVGGALLYPGVRPASRGDAGAAVVDVTSRRGGGDGDVRVMGDLSLASMKLALDRRSRDGRSAWMIAGRRSWIDWATIPIPDVGTDYAFDDLTGRFDRQLSDDRSLTVSALVERDHLGDASDRSQETMSRWGNSAARITYAAPFRGLRARYTLGLTHYGARTHHPAADSLFYQMYDSSNGLNSDNDILRVVLEGELSPPGESGSVLPWRVGYAVVHEHGTYKGPLILTYGGTALIGRDSISLRDGLDFVTLWGERRWSPLRKLTLDAGLRVEAGSAVENGGVVRLAPRITARWAPAADVAISAGVGRSYQYEQELGPSGVGDVLLDIPSGAWSSQVWTLAGRETPAIRSDIATLGAEAWAGDDWLLSINGYARRSTGVLTPDPAPGPKLPRAFAVPASNHARGVELSARRLAGRWTASFAYSYGVSTLDAAGLRFPAPGDRRHTLDATTMLRVGRGLRLGAAYTAASGAPYTAFVAGDETCTVIPCGEGWAVLDSADARRGPTYSSLDLLLDWTKHFRRWDFGAYLQVRNALDHDNAVTYEYSTSDCPTGWSGGGCPGGLALTGASFVDGIPILPLIGFRVRF